MKTILKESISVNGEKKYACSNSVRLQWYRKFFLMAYRNDGTRKFIPQAFVSTVEQTVSI